MRLRRRNSAATAALRASVLAAVQQAADPVSAHDLRHVVGAEFVVEVRSICESLERAGLIVRTDARRPITYKPATAASTGA